MLNIQKISKAFDNRSVLQSLSLTVERGTIALLLGPSGVGKSTLLRILSGLEKADAGEILLDSSPLASYPHPVGMVFQNYNLFENMTVEENISFALYHTTLLTHEEIQKETKTLLTQFNLKNQAHQYPSRLSGGQKQRCAIARTLAVKPVVVCMDEPTAALDPVSTSAFATIVKNLARQNYIILISTHDTSLLQHLDAKVHLVDNGSIIEESTSEEIRQGRCGTVMSNFLSGFNPLYNQIPSPEVPKL